MYSPTPSFPIRPPLYIFHALCTYRTPNVPLPHTPSPSHPLLPSPTHQIHLPHHGFLPNSRRTYSRALGTFLTHYISLLLIPLLYHSYRMCNSTRVFFNSSVSLQRPLYLSDGLLSSSMYSNPLTHPPLFSRPLRYSPKPLE